MPEITAAMVMKLREQTGAAMMLCKEALKETDADFDAAKVWIRKKLGSKLTGATDRSAAEGVIAAFVDGKKAAIVELNSETDFVARNEDFKNFAKELAEAAVNSSVESVEALLALESTQESGKTLQARLEDVYTKLRERIICQRMNFINTDANGIVATYVHSPSSDKLGVLVELEATSEEAAQSEAAETTARELAMQVAASRPRFAFRTDVPEKILQQEREIAEDSARAEGRPEAAIEKIIEGRTRKFYEETVLVDQVWLRDGKKSVTQVLKEAGLTLRRYVRYSVGETATE